MPREKLSEVGNSGQTKLLKLERNYEILAQDLAGTMDLLVKKA